LLLRFSGEVLFRNGLLVFELVIFGVSLLAFVHFAHFLELQLFVFQFLVHVFRKVANKAKQLHKHSRYVGFFTLKVLELFDHLVPDVIDLMSLVAGIWVVFLLFVGLDDALDDLIHFVLVCEIELHVLLFFCLIDMRLKFLF